MCEVSRGEWEDVDVGCWTRSAGWEGYAGVRGWYLVFFVSSCFSRNKEKGEEYYSE